MRGEYPRARTPASTRRPRSGGPGESTARSLILVDAALDLTTDFWRAGGSSLPPRSANHIAIEQGGFANYRGEPAASDGPSAKPKATEVNANFPGWWEGYLPPGNLP
jgi:hypothetical protein